MSYDFDYYSGNYLKAPIKPIKPFLCRNPTAIDARAYADAMEEYERNFESYKEDYSYYTKSKNALIEEFENRLTIEYDLSEKQFKFLWSESYDRRHSGGLEEVHAEFVSLYYLIDRYKCL